jgi:hypothetical protein
VKSEPPFFLVPFDDFNVEAQDFIPGLGDEDFQIEVPDGEALDQISLREGKFHRERIHLADYGIGTNYETVPSKQGFFLFEGTGALFFSSGGKKQVWNEDLESVGPTYGQSDGTALLFRQYIDRQLQFVRLHPENGTVEILLTLPERTPSGETLERHYVQNGFICTWGSSRLTKSALPAQFYGFDGRPTPHPLAVGLNLLQQHKIDLRPPELTPSYGAFYPSQTKDTWGLFCWKGLPNQPDKNLFLLSVTDTVQAVPVNLDRYDLIPRESLDFLLVNPVYNVFLAGARQNRNDDSIMIFLGRVRKDSTGKIYRAETFRVRYFQEIASPVFSRDGKVLLFASRLPDGTNLVFAQLADIVADVNRRYPNAKFDLAELK